MNESNNTTSTEEYLTFKIIAKFLKQAFPMIVLCTVTMVFLALITAGTFNYFTLDQNKYAEGIMELTFDGIDDGKDPYGANFNKDSIKDSVNIDAAMRDLGWGDNFSVSAVRQAFVIDGFLNKETVEKIENIKAMAVKDPSVLSQLDSIKQHPSKFIIRLNYSKINKMTKGQATALVDQLMAQYGVYFKNTYEKGEYFSFSAFNINKTLLDTDKLDYLEVYDNLMRELNLVGNYLSSVSKSDPNFLASSTGKYFSDLISELSAITSIFDSYQSIIVSNGLTKDINNIIAYLDNQKIDLINSQKAVQSNMESIAKIIENYKRPEITIPTGGSNSNIIIETAAYDEMHKIQINLSTQLANITKQLSNLENRITLYNANLTLPAEKRAELIDTLNNKFSYVMTEAAALYADANATIQEYVQVKVIDNAVKTVAKAGAGADVEGNMLIILAIGGGLFLGIALGCIVTYIRSKKTSKKKLIASN